jgi:transcriptional regulator NrdR family protein
VDVGRLPERERLPLAEVQGLARRYTTGGRLRLLDEVAYLHFASVYRSPGSLADFERETEARCGPQITEARRDSR